FTQDPQRLARFEREAKLLASLNHPNIAAIHSFEHSDEVHFLVLELVEGETLAERVAKGPLPVEEALEVCRQIAEGVEAAHEKGVIHRDLKPANVKITPEGKVKILDFGLAKAFEGETLVTDISQSPTLTEEMTRAGVILGTAAYMSPEQAKGKPVDKRADIFAFGALLYELLTGQRTFEGETITETIAAVLKSEPDWKALPATTPWRIEELLRRCLTKDVHDRLDGIGNVRTEIKLAVDEPAAASPGGETSPTQVPLWQRAIPWTIAVLMAVMAGVGFWSLTRPAPRPITRFPLVLASLPSEQQLVGKGRHVVALSPDGTHLVYVYVDKIANSQLYLRPMDQLEATPMRGTEGGREPFFSPDGQWVGFWAGGQLKKVSISGGAPVILCEASNPWGASWELDDTIVFGQGLDGIWKVSASGGTPEVLVIRDSTEGKLAHGPQILPGGDAVLFTLAPSSNWDDAQIVVQSLETGERKVLINGGKDARYAPTGHLVYALQGTLLAVAFDLGRLEVTGGPVPMAEGVMDADTRTGAAHFSFSKLGSLVYVPGGQQFRSELVWVDRQGQAVPLIGDQVSFSNPRVSPDGRTVAVQVNRDGRDIWIYDAELGTRMRLTVGGRSSDPVWTPDGERITFASDRSGGSPNLYWKPADGSGEAQVLLTREPTIIPFSWSPDGKTLAFSEVNPANALDIWTLSEEGDATPFVATSFNEDGPMFSPDGRLLAYVSNESGNNEVYVQPYPGPGGKWPISKDGGAEPRWSHDGRELFYRQGQQMMVVAVETEPTFTVGRSQIVFEGDYQMQMSRAGNTNYDLSTDSRRFLMVKASEQEAQTQINVVLNWFEELKRLVPTE
ncbi:protein kinase, partial [Acidobacteria bacterium AH-259-D05]|nr:protein kinase [Acidobacteria bacterium AH-259-D05]